MDNDKLIWYVCYGSNLCFDRFMCYLTGDGNEKYNILSNPARRCSDQAKPIKSKIIVIPYELYFARESGTWDRKGVCFIDDSIPSKTIGRAYLITKEQYEHVWFFEGKTNWYPKQIELGKIDGIRAVTFTSNSRNLPERKPSLLYFQVVKDGLVECGLSEDDADLYLKERIKGV